MQKKQVGNKDSESLGEKYIKQQKKSGKTLGKNTWSRESTKKIYKTKENKIWQKTCFLQGSWNSEFFLEQERWSHISNILCIIYLYIFCVSFSLL